MAQYAFAIAPYTPYTMALTSPMFYYYIDQIIRCSSGFAGNQLSDSINTIQNSPSIKSMAKRPISLSLRLTENEGTVSLIIEDEGKTIVDFENTEAPNVRVAGFAKRNPQFQQIISFMEREADSFSGGAEEALEAYIVSAEKQIYNRILHLRSEMRKLVITGCMLRAAKILRKQLRHTTHTS